LVLKRKRMSLHKAKGPEGKKGKRSFVEQGARNVNFLIVPDIEEGEDLRGRREEEKTQHRSILKAGKGEESTSGGS